MATAIRPRSASAATGERRAALIPTFAWPYWVSGALAVVASIASAVTFFIPDVLAGEKVMIGSARGTAISALCIAVPVLVISMGAVANGLVRPVIAWLGAVAYLQYNSVLFLFATPFNRLFLLYAATFALSAWSLVTVLHAVDVPAFARRFAPSLPARAIAAYMVAIAAANGLAWLARIVPALFSDRPAAILDGTGLTTNPVYVQDLSFWIPLMLVGSIWMWLRKPWGIVIVGALLVWGPIEIVGVVIDQAMGHAADPASTVASTALTVPFLVLAALGFVPLYFYLRHFDRRHA